MKKYNLKHNIQNIITNKIKVNNNKQKNNKMKCI